MNHNFSSVEFTQSVCVWRENEDEELCSVFVPTNHLYIGDIFLVNSKEIIRDHCFRRNDNAVSNFSLRNGCSAK